MSYNKSIVNNNITVGEPFNLIHTEDYQKYCHPISNKADKIISRVADRLVDHSILFLIICFMLLPISLLAQSMLFDNLHASHSPAETWFGPLLDTLRAHGAAVDFTTDVGFSPSGYELLWITFTNDSRPYTDAEINSIIEFVRYGGELVITANDNRGNGPLNDILTDSRWTTGMFIVDANYSGTTRFILPYSPFTDGVTEIEFWGAAILDISPPAIPWIFDETGEKVFAAVSYPLEFDCDTSGRILLFAETDFWEHWTTIIANNYKLASNVLRATAIPPLEDCFTPPGVITLDSVDCSDPGETVTAYGVGFTTEMLLFLADSNISFTWIDSFTIEFTIPDSLPQGNYRLEISYNIDSLDTRTPPINLQVFCDWLRLLRFQPFCGDTGDTIWFYGENFNLDAAFYISGVPLPEYEIISDTSGWFVIPPVSGGPYFRLRLENSGLQFVERMIRIPCTGCISDSIYAYISNVWFYQETNGSDRVHIFYDLETESSVDIDIKGSSNGGTTWNVPVSSVSGDVGNGITSGESLEIIWEAGINFPGYEDSSCIFSVIASDTSDITGPVSLLDTLPPPAVTAEGDSFWCTARFTGETIFNCLGVSVSSAGDVNSDGYDDIVVGAHYNNAGGTKAGRAYIFYGGMVNGEYC